jgi:hypothetical protein
VQQSADLDPDLLTKIVAALDDQPDPRMFFVELVSSPTPGGTAYRVSLRDMLLGSISDTRVQDPELDGGGVGWTQAYLDKTDAGFQLSILMPVEDA